MTEDDITFKDYHQSTIQILHLAHIFLQIDDFFVLDINLELLEASKLYRKFTLLVVPFTISTGDTMPRE